MEESDVTQPTAQSGQYIISDNEWFICVVSDLRVVYNDFTMTDLFARVAFNILLPLFLLLRH